MTSKLVFIAVISLLFCSCAKVQKKKIKHSKLEYNFTDKSGDFGLSREVGYRRQENEFVVKKLLSDKSDESTTKVLEKSITISTAGRMGESLSILRPKISQYQVWFDGKKYFSEQIVDVESKSLKVKYSSVDKEWNGEKSFPFPDGTGVFCFFSQVIECVQTTKFLSISRNKQMGEMNFHVIWEGFPFVQEQYTNLPKDTPFTKAILRYDGKTEKSEDRFSLKVGGEVIFYVVDDDLRLKKMFWVSQGVSVVRKE